MSQKEPKKPDLKLTTSKQLDWQEASGFDKHKGGLTGYNLISEYVKQLPNSPGVYRMFNANQDVLYVGKAKSLKKRVSSYAKDGGHSNRIAKMISETCQMEFVNTRTETEALLLEANLIKRLQPRFNILLRDDKSYPYIVITKDHEAPGIFKHRGAKQKTREYFGPFASPTAVNGTLHVMQRAFLLRTCTDSMYESRTRPCLLHQIKRCSAPCTDEISKEDYADLVKGAKDFLTGKTSYLQNELSKQMQEASDAMDFEQAAIYRDRLSALTTVQGHQGINPRGIDEADVFAIEQKGGMSCVQVFFFRTGQNWGNRSYFPRADKGYTPQEILSSFLSQFYEDKPCPKLILLSHPVEEVPLLAEAFSLSAGFKVSINAPIRGEKRDVIKHAMLNARETLERKLAQTTTQSKLLEGVAKVFELKAKPQRIEVYDNAHIQGTNAVGGMIVSGPEGFAKNQYRKFNIKDEDIVPGDDYGMMREVMRRRFSRLIKEKGLRETEPNAGALDAEASSQVPSQDEPDKTNSEMGAWPDLLLIDGGIGQLNAVKGVLEELEILDQVPIVGIAKGPDRDAGLEKFFMIGKASFMLPERDPVLYFVQRLRDEAHRFANGSHRVRRKKEMIKNPLDEIAGIGPTRKKALLHHFGSAKLVARAALSDLLAVDGISNEIAQTIFDHFQDS
ncbi:MAG: excinuclease ABC subunit UvrC [Nitratireductor sp.]